MKPPRSSRVRNLGCWLLLSVLGACNAQSNPQTKTGPSLEAASGKTAQATPTKLAPVGPARSTTPRAPSPSRQTPEPSAVDSAHAGANTKAGANKGAVPAKAGARPGTAAGLSYYLREPEGTAGQPLPLVVAVHGLGDDARNFALLFDAWPGRARIASLEAPERHGNGYRWMKPRAGRSAVAHAEELQGAASQVHAAILALQTSHPTVGKPLLVGFSQGGMISFALAVLHGSAIDRALPLSGSLPPSLWPKPQQSPALAPLVALHGTRDAVVPFAPTRQLVDELERGGARAELVPFEGVGHTLSGAMRSKLFELLNEFVQETRARCLVGEQPETCGS